MRTGKGTVLLVENNDEVALVSAEYFERLGYAVEIASSGSNALQNLQTTPPYALMFSDLLMPESVAGLELARIVREHHPDLPVLLTTGYSEKAQQAVQEGFSVLQKPYDLEALSIAVQKLLQESREDTPPNALDGGSQSRATVR
jgi:two-component system NtrC family sensor kinase